jgi:hypothetical protein
VSKSGNIRHGSTDVSRLVGSATNTPKQLQRWFLRGNL